MKVAIDSFFFGACLNIGEFFDALRKNFDGNIKTFVQNHMEILKLADRLNSFYQPIIFAQLLIAHILLCMIGCQIIMAINLFGLFLNAPFAIAALNQIFLYCLGGQIIHTKSESVAKDLYQNDRELMIIIAKATKGFQVEAAVYKANLPTLAAILSSTQGLMTFFMSLKKV